MAIRRRRAKYLTTLIFVNEPQLILLESQKNYVMAIAIPTANSDAMHFLAVTVTPLNFQRYMDGHCDLRYLFSFASKRVLYHFNLFDMNDNGVLMSEYNKDIPEAFLPLPRIFSSHHTEDYSNLGKAEDEQTLYIDGEWEMPELGRFQSRYSDVYSFVCAMENWSDQNESESLKRKIREIFLDRPFKGGFSYVHFYDDLAEIVPRSERLGLESINYASPGEVNIVGDQHLLKSVEQMITNFIKNRSNLKIMYNEIYKYLSNSKFLKSSGAAYPIDDPTAPYIIAKTSALNEAILGPEIKVILELSDKNALVAAKIVLSLYRRIEESAKFFAEGRMNYESS